MRKEFLTQFREFGVSKFTVKEVVPAWSEPLDDGHRVALGMFDQAVDAYQAFELHDAAICLKNFLALEIEIFQRQELIMFEAKYPHAAYHDEEHKRFADDLAKFLCAADGSEAEIGGMLAYIYCWLGGHILVDDRMLADFLVARGALQGRPLLRAGQTLG